MNFLLEDRLKCICMSMLMFGMDGNIVYINIIIHMSDWINICACICMKYKHG